MLMYHNLFKLTTGSNRRFSLSALRCIEVPSSKPLSEEKQAEQDESLKQLEWRKKPFQKTDAWYSKFKLFLQDDDEPVRETIVTKLQQPIDLRPSTMKKWYKKNLQKQERFLQQYVPERHYILGNDLAAAHFLVFRNAKVKFVGENNWIKMNEFGEYNLPDKYVDAMLIEAIDCEGTNLYYEGLENLRRLKHLRFLSFKNVDSFDDWCLDRISGSEFENLEVLDLSGTEITERGIQALYRVSSLKKLILDDPYRSVEWKLTLAMLQDIIPDLEIVENKPELESQKV